MIAFPKSTQDIIVASLKQRIAKQNLLPGTELKQVELAKYEIKYYSVIYRAIEDIEASLKGMLKPEYEEVVTSQFYVRS